MAQSILGIDVGSYSVKLVQIERSFSDFKIINFFELPLIGSEVLDFEQSVAGVLYKFFQETALDYDFISLSLPANKASQKILQIPYIKKQKLSQLVEFELEEYLPFDFEDVHYDFFELERLEQMRKVLVSYMTRSDFENWLNTLSKSDIEARYIGIDAVDLSYLNVIDALPKEGAYAVIDIGHLKSNLLVFNQAKLLSTRSFDRGGYHFTQALQEALEISFEEAEEIKIKRGQLLEQNNIESDALRQQALLLLRDIKQTFFALRDQGAPPIDALYFCGGGSKIRGLDQFFSNFLKINVSELDVVHASYSEFVNRESVNSIIPAALCAALRAIYPSQGVQLNFRTGVFSYRKDFEQLQGPLKKIAVLAAMVFGLSVFHYVTSYQVLSEKLESVNKETQSLIKNSGIKLKKSTLKKASSSKIKSILKGRINKQKSKMQDLRGDNALGAIDILKYISEAMPDKSEYRVDVSLLTINESRITLQLEVEKINEKVVLEPVDAIETALQKFKTNDLGLDAALFSKFQISNVRKSKNSKGSRFKISFDLNDA